MAECFSYAGKDKATSSGDTEKPQEAGDELEQLEMMKMKTRSLSGEPEPQPGWEVAFYLASFVAVLVYAAWDFFLAYGKQLPMELHVNYMKRGWLSEWMEFPPASMEQDLLDGHRFLIATSVGFLALSQLTLRKASGAPHYLATAGYTLAVTAAVVNTRSAVYMLLLHTGAVCVAYYSLAGVWLMVLAAMLLQNSSYSPLLFETLALAGNGRSLYFPIIGYLYCRSISAGHSLHRMLMQQRAHGSETPTFTQFLLHNLPRSLAYGFYLPWHYVGPILTYDEFCDEVTRSDRTAWDLKSAAALIWRGCRLLLWLLVLQAFHHFLPVGAFLQSIKPDASVPYSRLVLAMYLHGQNFMLSYIQFYGWAGLVARIDGVRLPHWPDCISRVYTYRKMWKVFDRGLSSFMQHHIYVPIGGSRHGVIRQVTGLAASFAFVSVYHGDTWGVRFWCALNAAQLMLEAAACGIYRARVKNWLSCCLSPMNHQRAVCYVIGCNLLLTSCFIFFFLVERSALSLLVEIFNPLVLKRPLWHLLLLLYMSYCIVQVSMHYERHTEAKQEKQH